VQLCKQTQLARLADFT